MKAKNNITAKSQIKKSGEDFKQAGKNIAS